MAENYIWRVAVARPSEVKTRRRISADNTWRLRAPAEASFGGDTTAYCDGGLRNAKRPGLGSLEAANNGDMSD